MPSPEEYIGRAGVYPTTPALHLLANGYPKYWTSTYICCAPLVSREDPVARESGIRIATKPPVRVFAEFTIRFGVSTWAFCPFRSPRFVPKQPLHYIPYE